jgi:hypothetical protein
VKLAEQMVIDAIAKLKAGLPQRLAAINMEKADEIVLLAPEEYAYYEGRLAEPPGLPAVWVMEGATRFRQEGAHGLLTRTELIVFIGDSDETGPRLARRLYRMARGVIETLYDDEPRERLANSYNLTPLHTRPGTVYEPEARHDRWHGFYRIVFAVDQEEL